MSTPDKPADERGLTASERESGPVGLEGPSRWISRTPAERVRRLLQQLCFPRRDMVPMHLAADGNLFNRLLAAGSFQGYLCLELR